VLDAGEQCDDQNFDPGDGCSPTCRRECTVDAECDDGDPCTIEGCVDNLCTDPVVSGVGGALCVTESLRSLDACTGEAGVRKLRLLKKVERVKRNLRRANNAARRGRFLKWSNRILDGVRSQSAKLATNGKLSPACVNELISTIDELQGVIDGLKS
jgi:cysteine-rich repeat protein